MQLRGEAGDDELSNAEIGLLDNIFSGYGKMGCWDLVSTAEVSFAPITEVLHGRVI